MRAWRLVAPIVLSALLTPGVALAEVGPKATLSVLATPVERVPAGGFAAERGVDGLNLSEGDRIKTGNGGLALITFLDGSTVTVLPASEVTVKQAGSDRRQRGIRLLIHAGQVWARVAEALGRRSTLSLESNDYAATAHDGLIGAGRGGGHIAARPLSRRPAMRRVGQPVRYLLRFLPDLGPCPRAG